MRYIVFILVLVFQIEICTGQHAAKFFDTHPNHEFYPFNEVNEANDSLRVLFQHFYFVCRENDITQIVEVKTLIDESLLKFNWHPHSGELNYLLGYYYRVNDEIDKAIQHYHLAMEIFVDEGYKKASLWAEMGLANCDYYLNRRGKAFESYKGLFSEAQQVDTFLSANLAFNIGIGYHEQFALKGKEAGVGYAEIYPDMEIKLASDQFKTGANEYYSTALKYSLASGDTLAMSHIYGLFGAFNSLEGNTELAGARLDSAMLYAELLGLNEQVAFTQINKGYHLGSYGHFEEGIGLLNKALTFYKKEENHKMSALALDRISNLYKDNGQFDLALEATWEGTAYYRLFHTQSLFEKSAFYETEFKTKELENETIKQEQELNKVNQENLQLENQRLMWTILFIIVLFLLVLSGVMFIAINRNRNRKVLLSRQQAEIKMQNELISETIRMQDETRAAIGREIHDGVCQTITALKLSQQQLLKEHNSGESNKVVEDLTKNIELTKKLYLEARNVSHELAPPGIQHNSLKQLLRKLCQELFIELNYSISDENLPENVFADQNEKKLHVFRILQELCINILKHAEATEIQIQAYQRANVFILRVEDNGKGIYKRELQEGIGMQSIRYRTEMMEGTFHYEKENGGVSILKVPVNMSKSTI